MNLQSRDLVPVPVQPVGSAGRCGKGREIGKSGKSRLREVETDLCGIGPPGYGGRRKVMKELTAAGSERDIRSDRRPTMESSIVDTMRRYFENDTGKSKGDLEYTIINSVKRYFEGKPPER
jgi:hypothetical protein